jgi:hypothetical protein
MGYRIWICRDMRSFTAPTTLRNLLVAQRSQPETFADNVRFHFEEAEQVLDDGGRGVVAVEIHETFAVDGWGMDECGLLGVVDEIAGVYA